MKMLLLFLSVFFVSCAHQVKPTKRPVETISKKYNRKEWKHWSDQDKNCRDTRAEILILRSQVPVKLNKKGCTVVSGKWNDYYYPETLTEARKVDIDHLIPLKHAHDVGGSGWTVSKKEKFANDPENLVITNRRYNRQKGAKTILEWMPVDKSYACKYARDWLKMKKKYQLLITQLEMKYSSELLKECH